MPIFDYKCQACGQVFELLTRSSGEDGSPACPDCGSRNLEKLVSAPVILRNSGNSGKTCCGREERCEKPPCSGGQRCHRR
jgi:putative FmdB family regulatory protein